MITLEDFFVKRPSSGVIVIVKLDGYEAYCVMEYMTPHVMEAFPYPGWQVVDVKFVANNR